MYILSTVVINFDRTKNRHIKDSKVEFSGFLLNEVKMRQSTYKNFPNDQVNKPKQAH